MVMYLDKMPNTHTWSWRVVVAFLWAAVFITNTWAMVGIPKNQPMTAAISPQHGHCDHMNPVDDQQDVTTSVHQHDHGVCETGTCVGHHACCATVLLSRPMILQTRAELPMFSAQNIDFYDLKTNFGYFSLPERPPCHTA